MAPASSPAPAPDPHDHPPLAHDDLLDGGRGDGEGDGEPDGEGGDGEGGDSGGPPEGAVRLRAPRELLAAAAAAAAAAAGAAGAMPSELELRGAGGGVWARQRLARGARFGPYPAGWGADAASADARYSWEVSSAPGEGRCREVSPRRGSASKCFPRKFLIA
ncbi:hypothetical protein R5R35_008708 [Gryllus longicercus]|uniref:Uncharacterized protein n=1 Tax=Gryllus longicercus TaxID=2509291 RepID=A0AAN9V7Q0_9ORTH